MLNIVNENKERDNSEENSLRLWETPQIVNAEQECGRQPLQLAFKLDRN